MTGDGVDFADFFSELYGRPPFPWQTDLARSVLKERSWPDVVDVPTGLGKTALLDIAVFVAAMTSGGAGADRPGRRRIFFVVDRRIVVDEAHLRGLRLSRALDAALAEGTDTATRRVAIGLRDLAPDAEAPLTIPPPVPVPSVHQSVLPVTRMRGGVTWDAAWLDRPDRPGLVVGTVDQVGSRLLFRGYGVSDRRKPIDAALVGVDALVLVDEAHLAGVMISTLTEAQRRDRSTLGLPPATVLQMTATPRSTGSSAYVFDVDAHRSNDVAWRRLNAFKELSVVDCPPKKAVAALVDATLGLIEAGSDTVLVVCNTVDRARQVHDELAQATVRRRDPVDAEALLLIGRSRPGDRELLTEHLLRRFGVDRDRSGRPRPSILVATQTVEVGANLDADGLVSESAPWDALVQRLGRLNRLGELVDSAQAIVIHDNEPDRVYGAPRQATWEWLGRVAGTGGRLDVSPLACRDAQPPSDTASEPRLAPLLTFPILDAWSNTAPPPHPDPPIAPYLHGLGSDAATITIAWRDGMIDDGGAADEERPEAAISADLAALPILATEQVEVPLHAARRWLRGEAAVPLSDLDEDVGGAEKATVVRDGFRAAAWRAGAPQTADSTAAPPATGGSWRWVEAESLRPGDTLVVPSERGGLDRYGWSPQSLDTVLDLAEVSRFRFDPSTAQLRRRWLRLDRRTGTRLGLADEDVSELRTRLRALAIRGNEDDTGEHDIGFWLADAIGRVLESHAGLDRQQRIPGTAWTPITLNAVQAWLRDGVELVSAVDRAASVLVGAGYQALDDRFLLTSRLRAASFERDDELPECSSMGLRPVGLVAHHTNVGNRARAIAEAIGLAPEVVRAVEAAARCHDLGKVEPRFQAMLCGGDRYEAMLLDEPLAKSGIDPVDRVAYRRARIRSGLPAGARHEAWSASLVRRHLLRPELNTTVDPDLVIHLVASHHGHSRPWLPPVLDEAPTEIEVVVDAGSGDRPTVERARSDETVDFDHPLRFSRLNARYGRWGLALLEAIVRCADMTVSGEGS